MGINLGLLCIYPRLAKHEHVIMISGDKRHYFGNIFFSFFIVMNLSCDCDEKWSILRPSVNLERRQQRESAEVAFVHPVINKVSLSGGCCGRCLDLDWVGMGLHNWTKASIAKWGR